MPKTYAGDVTGVHTQHDWVLEIDGGITIPLAPTLDCFPVVGDKVEYTRQPDKLLRITHRNYTEKDAAWFVKAMQRNGRFKGIGPKTMIKFLKHHPVDALARIANDPDASYCEIRGGHHRASGKVWEAFRASATDSELTDDKSMLRRAWLFAAIGFSSRTCNQILAQDRAAFGFEDPWKTLLTHRDPYALVPACVHAFDEVHHVALNRFGWKSDDPRVVAGRLRCTLALEYETRRKSTQARVPDLVAALGVRKDLVQSVVDHSDAFVCQDDVVALKTSADKERAIAHYLVHARTRHSDAAFADHLTLTPTPTEEQQHALQTMQGTGLTLLTGHAGCGKTTVLSMFVRSHPPEARVVFLAPTGKACFRAKQLIGSQCRADITFATIHSYYYKTIQSNQARKKTKRDDIPDIETLIVDECSMIDLNTMHMVVRAAQTANPARIVACGDPGQLASIGPGAIFEDIIATDVFPHARLTRVQRNSGALLRNAEHILHGRPLEFDHDVCKLVPLAKTNVQDTVQTVLKHVPKDAHPDSFVAITRQNVLVKALNAALQHRFNPAPKNLTHQLVVNAYAPDGSVRERRYWRVHDRVVNLVNNAVAANGAVGRIVQICSKGPLVRFDDPHSGPKHIWFLDATASSNARLRDFAKRSRLDHADAHIAPLTHLDHAYAVNTYKAQGSEYDHAFLVLPPRDMPRGKRFLYTSFTRAKKTVTVFGDAHDLALETLDTYGDRRVCGFQRQLQTCASAASS